MAVMKNNFFKLMTYQHESGQSETRVRFDIFSIRLLKNALSSRT